MYKIGVPILALIIIFPGMLFAKNAGSRGAQKDRDPLWLSECEKRIEEETKKPPVDPLVPGLPFWGRKLREQGYALPLPFGVGLNFIIMRQTVTVDNLTLTVDGENIPTDVRFYNTVSTDANITFRPDIWILPFLNVYGVFGYTVGEVNLDILVPGISAGPIPITDPFVLSDKLDYTGTTLGVGTTLAGGYKFFFATVDYNYTVTKLNVIDSEMIAHTISPRIGVILDSYKGIGEGQLWVGAMYINFKQTLTGTVDLSSVDPGLDDLGYSIDFGLLEPWNFLFGGAWVISPRMNLMFEVGVGYRSQFLTGFDFRF